MEGTGGERALRREGNDPFFVIVDGVADTSLRIQEPSLSDGLLSSPSLMTATSKTSSSASSGATLRHASAEHTGWSWFLSLFSGPRSAAVQPLASAENRHPRDVLSGGAEKRQRNDDPFAGLSALTVPSFDAESPLKVVLEPHTDLHRAVLFAVSALMPDARFDEEPQVVQVYDNADDEYPSFAVTFEPSLAVTLNTEALHRDFARVSALTIVCSPDTFDTRLVYTRRVPKALETSVTPAHKLFSNLSAANEVAICGQTLGLVRYGLRELVVPFATRDRLIKCGIEPLGLLGMGSTSCVIAANYRNGDAEERVAVKCVFKAKVFAAESDMMRLVNGLDGFPKLRKLLPAQRALVLYPVGTPLHKARLGAVQTGNVFRSIARGLESLYNLDVVHRDVSPGNVIIHGSRGESLCLIDVGMAQRVSAVKRSYSGARWFASDRVCATLGREWHSKVTFHFVDDVESLVKTAVWCLDAKARRIINEKGHEGVKCSPRDVKRMWTRIWSETKLGKSAFQFLQTLRLDDFFALAEATGGEEDDLDMSMIDSKSGGLVYRRLEDWLGTLQLVE